MWVRYLTFATAQTRWTGLGPSSRESLSLGLRAPMTQSWSLPLLTQCPDCGPVLGLAHALETRCVPSSDMICPILSGPSFLRPFCPALSGRRNLPENPRSAGVSVRSRGWWPHPPAGARLELGPCSRLGWSLLCPLLGVECIASIFLVM